MGKAIELSSFDMLNHNKKLLKLRKYTIDRVLNEIKGVKINGDLEKRLPGNINMSIEGVDAQALLLMLDMKGICASSGSACSTGSLMTSHVLSAIGLDNILARGSIRLSYGIKNTLDDAKYIVENLKEAINDLRKMSKNK